MRVERVPGSSREASCGPRRLRCALASGSRNVPSPPSLLFDGEWHHVAVTRKDGETRRYLDGKRVP